MCLLQHWRWQYEFKVSCATSRKNYQSNEKLGFCKISQKGSHVKYINEETKRVFIIPMHYEIAKGTLKSILE